MKKDLLKKFVHNGALIAVFIKRGYRGKEFEFFTPDEFGLQMGYQRRRVGMDVEAHVHKPFNIIRDLNVQEVFIILSGVIQVELFSNSGVKIGDEIISEGDIALLNCGHAMKILEEAEFIEIKQGPYRGKELDKRMI